MGLLDPFPTQLCNSAKRFKLLEVVEFRTVKGLNHRVPDTYTDWRILLPQIHWRFKFKERYGIRGKFMTKRSKLKREIINKKNHDNLYWSSFGLSISFTEHDCICTVHVVRSLNFNTNTCTILTSQVKIY